MAPPSSVHMPGKAFYVAAFVKPQFAPLFEACPDFLSEPSWYWCIAMLGTYKPMSRSVGTAPDRCDPCSVRPAVYAYLTAPPNRSPLPISAPTVCRL
jgi:hypothetical protein